ncbi:MAG: hypothetical protein M1831_000383 [Alyxoria varia]|nr:MAG: hypothetical protein M1831_000383 [Alyxoria varia]
MARPTGKASGGQQDGIRRAPKQQNFLFVDSSENAGPEGAKQGRRNARSFVMQNARRQRPWSTSKQPGARARPRSSTVSGAGRPTGQTADGKAVMSPSLAFSVHSQYPSSGTNDELMPAGNGSCWKCQAPSTNGQRLCSKCEPFSLKSNLFFGPLSSGKMDPFGSLPTDLDSQSEALTHHFFGVQTHNLLDIDIFHQSRIMRSSLFGLTMGSAAGMRATLCSSTIAHLAMGRASLADLLNRKCQLISEINTNLSDPLNGTHDSNIYAVATLITIEDALYDPRLKAQPDQAATIMRHRKIHFNGLKRMIEMRGGLKGLSDNRTFQIMITWHVIAHAALGCVEPYLDMSYWNKQVLFPHAPNFIYPKNYTSATRAAQALNLHADLIQALQDSSMALFELGEWFGKLRLRANPLEIQHRSMLIQHRSLEWLLKTPKDRKRRPIEDIIAMSLLGCLSLSTVSKARGFESEPGWMHSRVKKTLLKTTAQDWMSCPVALYWVMTIGALRSNNHPEQAWFVAQVREMNRMFDVNNMHEHVAQMDRFLFLEIKLEEYMKRLWDQLQNPELEGNDSPEKPELRLFAGLEPDPQGDILSANVTVNSANPEAFREFIFDESAAAAEEDDNKVDSEYGTQVTNFLAPGIASRCSEEPPTPLEPAPPLVPSGASASPASTESEDPMKRTTDTASAKYPAIDTSFLDAAPEMPGEQAIPTDPHMKPAWSESLPYLHPERYSQQPSPQDLSPAEQYGRQHMHGYVASPTSVGTPVGTPQHPGDPAMLSAYSLGSPATPPEPPSHFSPNPQGLGPMPTSAPYGHPPTHPPTSHPQPRSVPPTSNPPPLSAVEFSRDELNSPNPWSSTSNHAPQWSYEAPPGPSSHLQAMHQAGTTNSLGGSEHWPSEERSLV